MSDLINLLDKMGLDKVDQRNFIVHELIKIYSSPDQLNTLESCVKFKWKFKKFIWDSDIGKCALGISAQNTFAWILPSGKIERVDKIKNTKAPIPKWQKR